MKNFLPSEILGATKIRTNHIPRPILSDADLSQAELAYARREFDYVDWEAIARGEDSVSFVRYQRELIPLDTFVRCDPDGTGYWHGARGDSFFSAVVIRLSEDGESAILGLALS